MNYEPLGDRVLLKINKKEETTSSGLFIPGGKDGTEGTVVAVGKGLYTQTGTFIPTSVNVGDIVRYPEPGPYNGVQEIEFSGDDSRYILSRESDLLMVKRQSLVPIEEVLAETEGGIPPDEEFNSN